MVSSSLLVKQKCTGCYGKKRKEVEKVMETRRYAVKHFANEQKVYVLYMYQGRNHEPEIFERTVEKVGRKYVTDNKGVRYGENPNFKSFLMEEAYVGEKGFLSRLTGANTPTSSWQKVKRIKSDKWEIKRL